MKILLIDDENTADEIVAFFHGFCSAESTNCSVGVLAREGGEGRNNFGNLSDKCLGAPRLKSLPCHCHTTPI